MSYKTTKQIKSLARGGVSLAAGASCTPQAFTDTLWSKLIKEGAIVEVAPPVEDKPKPAKEIDNPAIYANSKADATRTAIKLADKHGLQLYSVKGTGENGRITTGDVKALIVEGEDA